MSDGEDQTPNISDVGSDGEEETSAVDSLDLPKVPSEPQPVIPELYSKFLEQQEVGCSKVIRQSLYLHCTCRSIGFVGMA